MSPDQTQALADKAMKRLAEFINRSCAQHIRYFLESKP
jgi:hypothetical protein